MSEIEDEPEVKPGTKPKAVRCGCIFKTKFVRNGKLTQLHIVLRAVYPLPSKFVKPDVYYGLAFSVKAKTLEAEKREKAEKKSKPSEKSLKPGQAGATKSKTSVASKPSAQDFVGLDFTTVLVKSKKKMLFQDIFTIENENDFSWATVETEAALITVNKNDTSQIQVVSSFKAKLNTFFAEEEITFILKSKADGDVMGKADKGLKFFSEARPWKKPFPLKFVKEN